MRAQSIKLILHSCQAVIVRKRLCATLLWCLF